MDWRAEVEAARQMVAIHETLRMPGAAHPHRVIVEIGNALDAAERDRDEARAMLGELLARVHRDGGHRADAAGLAQATREADEIIARLMAERERDVAVARLSRIEAIRDEARATLGAGQGARYEGLTDAARRVVRERDDARAEAERLREQVRVWRTLAREGSIASADLGVIGPDATLALARCARRASEHAAQGAEAAREACAALCDGIAARWEAERAAGCSDVARAAAGGTAAGALVCADAIRARGGGA